MESVRETSKRRSSRSVILLQVTVLVIVIFLIFGIVSIIGNRRSQNNLIEAGKEKLIEEEAETISSSSEYILKLISELISSRGETAELTVTQFGPQIPVL